MLMTAEANHYRRVAPEPSVPAGASAPGRPERSAAGEIGATELHHGGPRDVALIIGDTCFTRRVCRNPIHRRPGVVCGGRWSPAEAMREVGQAVQDYLDRDPTTQLAVLAYNFINPSNEEAEVVCGLGASCPENIIGQIVENSGGHTYLTDALTRASDELLTDPRPDAEKRIVLVTPDSVGGEDYDELYQMAQLLHDEHGIRIDVIVAVDVVTRLNPHDTNLFTAWARMVAFLGGGQFTIVTEGATDLPLADWFPQEPSPSGPDQTSTRATKQAVTATSELPTGSLPPQGRYQFLPTYSNRPDKVVV